MSGYERENIVGVASVPRVECKAGRVPQPVDPSTEGRVGVGVRQPLPPPARGLGAQ